MDFGKAFSYPFQDSNWISRIIIGGIINLIPILNLAAIGYTLAQMKRVARGEEVPLEEWNDIGSKWMDGLLLGVAVFVWMLPGMLVFFLLFMPAIISAGAGDSTGAFGAAYAFGALIFGLWGALVALVTPAIYINYARKGTIGACFEFSTIFGILSENVGEYISGLVALLVAGFVVGIIGMIPLLGFILVPFVSFYIILVFAGSFGQILKKYTEKPAVEPSSE